MIGNYSTLEIRLLAAVDGVIVVKLDGPLADLGDFGVVHLDLIIDGMAGAPRLLVALTSRLLGVLRVCGQRPQSERDRHCQTDPVSGIHAQGSASVKWHFAEKNRAMVAARPHVLGE
jgi:hypothetical protein